MKIDRILQTERDEDMYGDTPMTVVTLSPNQAVVSVDFEDAFGEYSEARGDRRKRRAGRKLERVAEKRELRKAKGEAKGEKQMDRAGRRTGRTMARQERKTLRSDSRQGRRTGRTAARQERRGMRTAGRVERKELQQSYKEPEEVLENEATEEQGYAQESPKGELPQGGSNSGYSNEEENVDSGYADESSNEGDSYEERGYEDEAENSNQDEYLDESGDESSFNGEATGDSSIDPKVKAAAMRVEWHKNKIEGLKNMLDNMRVTNGGEQMRRVMLMRELGKHNQAMHSINSGLDSYASSSADGEYSEARGKMVKKARMKASNARLDYKRKKAKVLTPVKRSLKAAISKNKIVIDPTSNAEGEATTINISDLQMNDSEVGLTGGTGIIALDVTNEDGAPETRMIDVNYSNATGDKSSNKNMALKIGAGVALGVLAIYFINKYKLIK
jgi:hypothetical protein